MAAYKCDDCFDGILFEKGECPTCGPGAVPRVPQRVAEFKRKLASPEWHQLVEATRKHLGIPVEPNTSESEKVMYGMIDDLMKMLFEAQDVASGEASTFGDLNQDTAIRRAWWVEFRRVAASLATYLGTTSTMPIQGFLLGLFPDFFVEI